MTKGFLEDGDKYASGFDYSQLEEKTPRREQQPIEVKNRRVQLVFRPSTYNKANMLASNRGISLNELIHQLIEEKGE